jgi:tetratricopeptide (TPR) repeat protein
MVCIDFHARDVLFSKQSRSSIVGFAPDCPFGSPKAANCHLLFASLGLRSTIDFAFTSGEGAVNEQRATIGSEDGGPPPIFISYATADRTEALKVCKALEGRGTQCWISMRDVPPGANYQEAIVQSLRTARAVVLVFSDAANTSGEIKKELSLASRYQVPVIALRLEDVEPSDAFAYELSTRQWINAFEGWDKSIDTLVGRIGQISGTGPVAPAAATPASRRTSFSSGRGMVIAAAGLLSLVAAAGIWWALRPPQGAAHSMTVRLAGFQLLSADLPATLRDTVDAEITAAFNVDGVVGVSTAPAPAPGAAPAYTLGGTIQRDGPTIRVITRMVNERSGATLWSETFNYDGNEVSRVPRHIAVDAGNVVRCGLFGVSTYYKPLPDTVLRDYMQFCQGHWDPKLSEGRKALIPAQRVVAAVPDFSWGWAAVAGAYWKVAMSAGNSRFAEEARASGRQAADRAVAIDSRNSEALYLKSLLLDWRDWIGREDLLKRAVAARRLDCGCEFHQYGWMLVNVGRTAEAVEQLHRATDMLALYVYTPMTLAEALVVAGKPDEAKPYFDAAIDLAPDAGFAKWLTMYKATEIGDINLLLDPTLPLSAELRAALLQGYRALASRDSAARAQAVQALLALAEDQQSGVVARLLADLGANHEAFQIATRLATTEDPGPSLFWYRSMRGTLTEPGFPAVVTQLGLFKYWTTTRTRPDVCNEKAPPPFCRMI